MTAKQQNSAFDPQNERGRNFIGELAMAAAAETLSLIKQQHVCIHEADIAIVLDAVKRNEIIQVRITQRHEELQQMVQKNAAASAVNDQIVKQLGQGMVSLQEIVRKNTLDIATARAEKKTALIVISLVSAALGSLGGVAAMLTVFRGLFHAL